MSTLAIVPRENLGDLATLALAAVPSPITRMSYRGYLRKFLEWTQGRPLNRDTVTAYVSTLRDNSKSASVVRQAIKAIRVLASEARIRHLITEIDYQAILAVKQSHQKGNRAGNWIQLADVQELIRLPRRKTLDGMRDAAMLGLLVGCGLRRAEVATITWDKYQTREGRKVLVDLVGKGGKIRTVPVPGWVAADLDRWWLHNPDDRIVGCERVNIWYTVHKYMKQLAQMPGHEHCANVSPHDLRRTLAKMMDKSGVPLSQISATLGHSSLLTTQRYLGIELELGAGKAGVDQIHIVTEEPNGSDGNPTD